MNKNAVNICVDAKMIEPAIVFLYSIFKTSPKFRKLDYIICYDENQLKPSELKPLVEFIDEYGGKAILVESIKNLPRGLIWKPTDHVSIATYFRLFLPDHIYQEYERVLYFDVDMIAIGDIQSLLNENFVEPIAAVKHYSPLDEFRLKDLCDGEYFNAGVIVYNCEKMESNVIKKGYLDVLNRYQQRIKWHDQDVLNIYFSGKWHKLEEEYNCNKLLLKNLRDEIQPKLVHYDGWDKPWISGVSREYDKLWKELYYEIFNERHISSGPKARIKQIVNKLKSKLKILIWHR